MTWLRQLPQSTKVLLAVAGLALGVTLWYVLFFLPGQNQAAAPLPPAQSGTPGQTGTPPAVNPSTVAPARPLEVLPIPFLATQAPAQPKSIGQANPPGPAV
ncbi:MAG: competence protein, partial [Meiothermus sp.]